MWLVVIPVKYVEEKIIIHITERLQRYLGKEGMMR